MNIIKVRFLKDGKPTGRAYTYYSPVKVSIGDIVRINSASVGIVTEVDVPESEIAVFKDKAKTIMGLVKENLSANSDDEVK